MKEEIDRRRCNFQTQNVMEDGGPGVEDFQSCPREPELPAACVQCSFPGLLSQNRQRRAQQCAFLGPFLKRILNEINLNVQFTMSQHAVCWFVVYFQR